MIGFRVTYDIVTDESAARGDTAESGFLDRDGLHSDEPVEMTLREALNLAQPQEDCSGWWCEVDGNQDIRTGAVETRSIHPPRNLTAASYDRINRLLGI